jgi:hypothetical protein
MVKFEVQDIVIKVTGWKDGPIWDDVQFKTYTVERCRRFMVKFKVQDIVIKVTGWKDGPIWDDVPLDCTFPYMGLAKSI